jgi:opacity protein-like surface antigen
MKSACAILSLLVAVLSPMYSEAVERGVYVGIDAGQGRTELEADQPVFSIGPPLPTRFSHDERDTSVGLHIGYEFSNRFAIELSYSDLGETRSIREVDLSGVPVGQPSPNFSFTDFPPFLVDRPSFGPPVAGVAVAFLVPEREVVTFESKSLSLSMIGRFPLGESVSIFGSAGISAQKIDSNISIWNGGQQALVINGDDEHSSGAGVLGLGAQWAFHPRWYMRAQVQRHFTLGDESVLFASVGDVTLFTGGVGFKF